MSPSCWNLKLVSNSGSSGSDSSFGSVDIWVRFLFHLLTSLLAAAMAVKRWKFWKWLASKQLLQSVDHKYRRWESSTVLTRSGLRSCWKNAISSKVLDPSSFFNQRKVLPASSPSCQENSLQFGKLVIICRKTTTQFCCFCWSSLREWSTAYSIINNNHYHSGLNSYKLYVMILSSFITISDWLPLAKQKSTYNFELEMLVNRLLKFENLITIVEKRKRLLTEFKCRSYYEVDCFLSILVTSPDEEFWSQKQPSPRIYVKGSSPPPPPPIILFQKTSENVFQWLFLWNFGVFWQYLGEQASDRQLPVSRICKQRQNYESVEKIVRF